MSGVTRQSYAPDVKIIRLMCTGRVDISFIVRAFRSGADGVIIGGCWPGECHYVTEGNFDALGNVYLAKMILKSMGIRPERVKIEWIAASEGSRFAEVMNSFVEEVRGLGPLGMAEDLESRHIMFRLSSIEKLVPYIKLVEREKLRVSEKREERYEEFFNGEDAQRLFTELIEEKLMATQVLSVLKGRALSAEQISNALALSSDMIRKCLSGCSKLGYVYYDEVLGAYRAP